MKLKQFPGPAAWQANNFSGDSWIDVLTTEQGAELVAAANSLPIDEDQWPQLQRDDLLLPTLEPRRLGRINTLFPL